MGERREVTAGQFAREREALLDLASRGVEVVVLDEQGRPLTVYCTPRDRQPMRFD